MTNMWGSIPEWIGAVGTVGALLWAVFLFWQNLKDKEIAQARLLSIVSLPGKTKVSAGHIVNEVPTVLMGGNAQPRTSGSGKLVLVTTAESERIKLHMVSASDETFFIESVSIIRMDKTIFSVPNSWPDIAPRADAETGMYFEPGDVGDAVSFRVIFRDAAGRRWERVNRQPVRRLRDPWWKKLIRRLKRSKK